MTGTRERVLALLREAGPSTAALLGQRLALTPAAVRKHLDALLADGAVTTREPYVRGPRGRGRPARLYLLTDVGRGAGPTSERPAALAAALSADGYAATTGAQGTGVQLCQHHCPVQSVAAQFPQLCEAETAALGRLLDVHVQRLATLAHGDGVCTTFIPAPPTTATGEVAR